jgi:ATP-binding cassette, subfamily B, putative efflux pump
MVAGVEDAVTTPTGFDRREITNLVWRERRLLLVALVAAIVGPLSAMALPVAAKLVIDDVVAHGRTELLLPIAFGTAAAILTQAVAAYGLAQAGAVAGQRVVAQLRKRLYRHALALPIGYFDISPTGTLVSRCMADTDQVKALFGPCLFHLVSGMLTAVLAFGMLASVDWMLTVLVALMLVLTSFWLARGLGRLHPAFHFVGEVQAQLAGRLTEVFGGVRVVKTACAERREALALTRQCHRLMRASLAAHQRVALLTAAVTLAGGAGSLGILMVGGRAVARGTMTLGELALFVFLVGLLIAPVLQVAALTGEMGRGMAALARIREVLALSSERSADRQRVPIRRLAGTVAFDQVSYRYGAGPLVLREVSFAAPEGSTTAIMGPNGAGKSTVMGLLLALDDPTSGRVLIDGRPLSGLRVGEYRRHVGVVLQRDQIIDGTVADNIRYARPGATLLEFRRAAQLAGCDELVTQLPRGYDTMVGERGVRLSGGQRQRIAIARAFLADPRILLLDEATAHLDCESERLIADALATLCRGRTAFVVTHRLGTIQRADQILILESGAIAERGTHEELLGRRGRYWRTCDWGLGRLEAEIHAN